MGLKARPIHHVILDAVLANPAAPSTEAEAEAAIKNWLRLSGDPCEKRMSSAVFQRISGLDRIIGAIDGCHIRLQRPPIRGGDYMNWKCYYFVLLQGIVNDEGRFIDIFAGPPGRVHDARMLRGSAFYDNWQEKMEGYRLLGDSA
ncbi:hypothetical protein ACEWY4_006156 [Coilia grayii]|uniref:DDE Tnp4 domain-containing protein n=1 Tax=Coilia grayii TaxID=363190 RepID=A0ABD1KD13_9TELE